MYRIRINTSLWEECGGEGEVFADLVLIHYKGEFYPITGSSVIRVTRIPAYLFDSIFPAIEMKH
jgi:hypothetical protein